MNPYQGDHSKSAQKSSKTVDVKRMTSCFYTMNTTGVAELLVKDIKFPIALVDYDLAKCNKCSVQREKYGCMITEVVLALLMQFFFVLCY